MTRREQGGEDGPAWARVLRVQARRLGLTQREVARRVGKSEQEVGRWFCGRHEPDRPNARLLLDALELSAAWPPEQVEAPTLGETLVGNAQARRRFAGKLDERERVAFLTHLAADEPVTLAELALGWGVSRERARQIVCGVREKIEAACTV